MRKVLVALYFVIGQMCSAVGAEAATAMGPVAGMTYDGNTRIWLAGAEAEDSGGNNLHQKSAPEEVNPLGIQPNIGADHPVEGVKPFDPIGKETLPTFKAIDTQNSGIRPGAAESLPFVANTREPDPFIALRSAPSFHEGKRIAVLPNGTLLQILERRPDGWNLVRTASTGQTGWVLGGRGIKSWIECCKSGEIRLSGVLQQPHLYSPPRDSSERTMILDAARRAQQTSSKFNVKWLSVYSSGDIAIAFADLQAAEPRDASGGLFFLEAIQGNWRALYSLFMDGADNCERTVKFSQAIIKAAALLNAPGSFFPPEFVAESRRAASELASKGSGSECTDSVQFDEE